MAKTNGKSKVAEAPPPSSEETKAGPVHEIRLGCIKAAIWANQTEVGIRHNVTISRLWKDGPLWKRSENFGRDHLPLVMKVAELAFLWIYEIGSQIRQESGNPQGEIPL
jgi:hypothetical protein